MKYISTIYLCTAVSIISSAFYCRQHALVPRIGVETKCFRGGTRVLRALAVFREYMLRALEISTGSTRLILLSTPSISDVCTAGTACCTRGSVLLIILPVLAVFRPSVLLLLILPVRAVFRTPHTRVLSTMSWYHISPLLLRSR